MKVLFVLLALSFSLGSSLPLPQNSSVHSSASLAPKTCGPRIKLTNPITPGSGGYGSFGITQLTVNSTGGTFTANPYLYTGDPDQFYFPTYAGNSVISVTIYCDWDEKNNYVGIMDPNGNIVQCFLLSFGTHTYTFNSVFLECSEFTVFITDQPC